MRLSSSKVLLLHLSGHISLHYVRQQCRLDQLPHYIKGHKSKQDFQVDYYGGVKKDTVPEGIGFWAEVSGSAEQLIESLLGGLRSGLTYGGARNIKELQRKAEFVEVTSNYTLESYPRK